MHLSARDQDPQRTSPELLPKDLGQSWVLLPLPQVRMVNYTNPVQVRTLQIQGESLLAKAMVQGLEKPLASICFSPFYSSYCVCVCVSVSVCLCALRMEPRASSMLTVSILPMSHALAPICPMARTNSH